MRMWMNDIEREMCAGRKQALYNIVAHMLIHLFVRIIDVVTCYILVRTLEVYSKFPSF